MMDLGPAPSFHPLFKTSNLNKLSSDWLPLANRRSEQQVGGVNVLRLGCVSEMTILGISSLGDVRVKSEQK